MTNNDNSLKRRKKTRESGYKSHKDATGKEVLEEAETIYLLKKGEKIEYEFHLKDLNIIANSFVGFGGWFYVSNADNLSYDTLNFGSHQRKISTADREWSTFGSLEVKTYKNYFNISNPIITFTAKDDVLVAFYKVHGGIVQHDHLDNLFMYAPEANFIKENAEITTKTTSVLQAQGQVTLWLKRCNRCARFLPVNIPNDNHTLSFGRHRRFVKHVKFNTKEHILVSRGFQLECRFCKKFAVNLPLNRQRNADQMKEDAARRRGFEALLEQLYGSSAQLSFRKRSNGKELTTTVWNNFNRKCFSCDKPIPIINDMNLDHTRPLSLLWPLDETATCLCKDCNSQKNNQTPLQYYSKQKLIELSRLTNLPINELKESNVNIEAVKAIIDNLPWLMQDFLVEQNLNKFRDGKNTAELFLAALQRAFDQTVYGDKYDLIAIYKSYHPNN